MERTEEAREGKNRQEQTRAETKQRGHEHRAQERKATEPWRKEMQ